MAWGRTLNVVIEAPETPVIFDYENEMELKHAYAAAVLSLRPEEWPQAGFIVFEGPENYGRAMQAKGWINDVDVLIELKRLRRLDKAGVNLPTKEEMAAHLYQRAKDEIDLKAAAPLYKQVAEMLEFMPKAGPAVQVNTQINNVLRVPERAKDAASFAERFKESQTKLVRDARSSRPDA